MPSIQPLSGATKPLVENQDDGTHVPVLKITNTLLPTGVPKATSVTTTSATTAAAGGVTFVTFPPQACTALDVVNVTGTTIEVQRGGAGVAIPLLSGQARLFVGVTNANQLGIRRVDQSANQVTVQAEAIVA